jgi:hypothetical protein
MRFQLLILDSAHVEGSMGPAEKKRNRLRYKWSI